ncbi:uncharacterized protein CMU_022800 [Cryptosporidium muris RN66]|uniref:Uncharacterized protein n=1 Tax=Cryptosporidium muris (strain RN66) TaxID=441375 RepID=B6ABS2_CRYMR|nr:uncharacterized protein CMU_022800 [Cryptosporidium muris RN66]EEA05275.1 hypothetical protein, conserved [Cryptosporidium muris RN66]|eukprot:XP_002139624.1 hypothetical protein [Cryptosporidium muris RN66]
MQRQYTGYYASASIIEDQNINSRYNFGSRLLHGDSLQFSNSLNLNDIYPINISLTGNLGDRQVREYDDYIENWEGDENGLIWGSKESKDGSWNEQWIEQRRIPKSSHSNQISSSESDDSEDKQSDSNDRNNNTASLGQLNGINYINHTRWTEKWFRKGRRMYIRKRIEKLCENNEEIKDVWYEDIECTICDQDKTKLKKTNRYGKNSITGDEWRETIKHEDNKIISYLEERNLTSDIPIHHFKITKLYRDGSKEIQIRSNKRDINLRSTNKDSFKSQYSLSTTSSIESLNNDTYKSETSNSFWEEHIKEDSNGKKEGRKSGTDSQGNNWYEVWFEEEDGTKENDRWYYNENHRWGEKYGYSKISNECYSVKWDIDETGSSAIKCIEKSWDKPGENDSWGEYIKEVVDYTDNLCSNKLKSTTKSHWYNNGNESYKEQFHEKAEFDNEISEIVPISINRDGTKFGFRVSDNESWGEDWEENLTIDDDGNMIRKFHSTDKWWANSQGEKWGEKRKLELKPRINDCSNEVTVSSSPDLCQHTIKNESIYSNSYIEYGENWHKTNQEDFIDKWEINGNTSKGYKTGCDKRGGENRTILWEEEWNESTNERTENKKWTVYDQNGEVEVWGENFTSEVNGKKVRNKWIKRFNHTNREIVEQEITEKWEDDGKGNIKTLREGKGDNNWFSEQFGESLENSEKWAFKEGYDEQGTWIERWSERPGYKEAWKKGENCFGDRWEEEWKEDFYNKWKWAQKSGKNGVGDEWKEEWKEESNPDNTSRKHASKYGKKLNTGEEWKEEWGEFYAGIGHENMGDGGAPAEYVEKWTNKYATDGNGNVWGNSWGNRWQWDSKIKSWGDIWINDKVLEKWAN